MSRRLGTLGFSSQTSTIHLNYIIDFLLSVWAKNDQVACACTCRVASIAKLKVGYIIMAKQHNTRKLAQNLGTFSKTDIEYWIIIDFLSL